MITLAISITILLLTALPLAMFLQNLPLFHAPATPPPSSTEVDALPLDSHEREPIDLDFPGVSILIPARNEESSIDQCIRHASQCNYPRLEIVVLDDASSDQTPTIVRQWIERDPRIKLLHSIVLPDGWNGKQHACWRLAQAAKYDWLLFIDADVRLSADSVSRLMFEVTRGEIDLLSAFPKQVTRTFWECLLIPLMHTILLGYLPLGRMRASTGPEFAAGCGQLFLARRAAYVKCDGHRSIAASRHDGVKLPRAFRRCGLRTDLVDGTSIASCRMYGSTLEVVRGLLKNATEGIAGPKTIVPFTLLLGGGFVLPLALFVWGATHDWPSSALAVLFVATLLSYIPRTLAAIRFQQSWLGVVFHPLAVCVFLILQWFALISSRLGFRIQWKGRS